MKGLHNTDELVSLFNPVAKKFVALSKDTQELKDEFAKLSDSVDTRINAAITEAMEASY